MIQEIHPNDVIFGRLALAKKQTGNQLLDHLADQKKHEYKNSFYREQKKLMAEDIIEEIKRLNPPGRFLEPESKSKSTFGEIDHDKSITKVCKILRASARKAGEDDIALANHPIARSDQKMHPIE